MQAITAVVLFQVDTRAQLSELMANWRKMYSISPATSGAANQHRAQLVKHQFLLLLALTLALVACLCWTKWLMLLTIAPNPTVNFLTGTQRYDNGAFWLLADSPPSVLWLGVTGLAIVDIGYYSVAVQLVKWFISSKRGRRLKLAPEPQGGPNETVILVEQRKAREAILNAVLIPLGSVYFYAQGRFKAAFSAMSTETYEFNVKLIDLAVQAAWLYQQVLEAGAPEPFVWICTAAIVANAALWMWSFLTNGERLHRVLVELVFDFQLAVLFPITTLWYSLADLALDYKAFDITYELYPLSSLQRSARALADPVKTMCASHIINTQRILSVFTFFTQVGSNLALCRRFYHIVELLKADKNPRRKKSQETGIISTGSRTRRRVSLFQSRRACIPHPECAVHSYRWVGEISDGEQRKCPCRILVIYEKRIKSFSEWVEPKDATEKVSNVAAAGTLEALQVINQKLTQLPNELQRCTARLKYISLVHTDITVLPSWFKTFHRLEYLYIQGKPSSPIKSFQNLERIPLDAFENMPYFAFMHLADHNSLPAFPSLQNLQNLRALTLVFLNSIEEFPGLGNLSRLQRLVLLSPHRLQSLPDLASIKHLEYFFLDGAPLCCNGFIPGHCDTSDRSCMGMQCTSPTTSKATLNVFSHFNDTVCARSEPTIGHTHAFMTPERIALCDGVAYRECTDPDTGEMAMCVNNLFLPIWCNADPLDIIARRREIAAGVGEPCDPVIEGWLGCSVR